MSARRRPLRGNAGKANMLAGVIVLSAGAGIAWLLLKQKPANATPWERGVPDAPHPNYDAGGSTSSW